MLIAATFLHSFDWKLPPGTSLDLSDKFGLVLKKKVPLVAIPTPRLSNLQLYYATWNIMLDVKIGNGKKKGLLFEKDYFQRYSINFLLSVLFSPKNDKNKLRR